MGGCQCDTHRRGWLRSGDCHHWGVGHVRQHHLCKDLGFDKPRPWPLLDEREARDHGVEALTLDSGGGWSFCWAPSSWSSSSIWSLTSFLPSPSPIPCACQSSTPPTHHSTYLFISWSIAQCPCCTSSRVHRNPSRPAVTLGTFFTNDVWIMASSLTCQTCQDNSH